jgi:hypothetical protein
MSAFTVSRLGQKDGAGDAKALFLKVYGGEVMTAFEETNVMASRHMVRSISSGKSAQFPATWKGTASYHTPGTQLTGTTVNHNERVISIDDLLVADRFIANIDEAMNHYDVRSIYSKDSGRALAKEYDVHLQQVAALAAQASATVSGGNGGDTITDADADTSGSSLIASIFDSEQNFDEKDVPSNDRYAFVKPAQYNLLAQVDKAINKDYTSGNGDYAKGSIFTAAGMEIVKTNNLPQGVVATGPTAYQGTFSNNVCLCMQKLAVGTVTLIGMAVESEYKVDRQGTLMVAKMAVGHGILRPECASEIATA